MISTIQTVKSDFDKVIKYSQNLNEINTQGLLESWYKAKEDIIKRWNGELIYESQEPVVFHLNEDEKNTRLTEFINFIYDTYDNDDLTNFLEDNRADFFNNCLSHDYYISCTTIKIPKGMKIIKAFKYFEEDEKVLHNLQDRASMILQEDKITGTLCLSVHPLDYLSSSENTYHWRSCHALDGDYRAGNLSYMLDSSTIVCYLKGDDKKYKLPNFPEDVPWNSKKWRMLLFLEEKRDALFAGRQYPFFSSNGLTSVSKLFFESIDKSTFFWSPWYNDFITKFPRADENCRSRDSDLYGRYICMNSEIYGTQKLITDAKDSQHFNDLLYSSFYVPYYCWNYYPENDKRELHFTIGSAVPCVRCGKTHINMDASMICLKCEEEVGEGVNEHFVYCGCCERRLWRDDAIWMDGIDDYICPECRESETTTCEKCGSIQYNCNIVYSHNTQRYICSYCAELEKEVEFFKNCIIRQEDD